MEAKRIKELTEHELGILIYHETTGCCRNTALQVMCHKNFDPPGKERCKILAKMIFNNEEVHI